jgi:sulfite reductase (NADPH) hemoprotein beta-component
MTAPRFACDIGIRIVKNEAGEVGFEVWVGGGLGRTPIVGVVPQVPAQGTCCPYLEAILRVYNLLGRRDNIYKARIKILVQATGGDKFAAMVEEEWQKIKDGPLHLPQAEIERIHRYFAPPVYETLPDIDPAFETAKLENPEFARWARTNLVKHKVPGYAIANVSLKPDGGAPGDASGDQMDILADLADEFSLNEVRVTHHQNIVFPNVRKRDLFALWQRLKPAKLATSNSASSATSSPAGLDYCNLANGDPRWRSACRATSAIRTSWTTSASCGSTSRLHQRLRSPPCRPYRHPRGRQAGARFYQVTVGGSSGRRLAGQDRRRGFLEDDIVPAIDTIINTYLTNRTGKGERFLDYVRRAGVDPFKEALYGPATARRPAAE